MSLRIHLGYIRTLKQFRTGNHTSICGAIHAVNQGDAFIEVEHHFKKNKPNLDLHCTFWRHLSFTGDVYWWHGEGKKEQRILFLQKMVKITRPWYLRIFYTD